MSDSVKIALVGWGNIAQAHWAGIRGEAPHVAVTAVVDTNADMLSAMAEKTGAAPFSSLEDLSLIHI